MRLRKRLLIGAAATVAALGLCVAVSASSNAATQPEVCNSKLDGLCWNNWGGANNSIRMYSAGVTNDAFRLELIDVCNSNPPDTVTGTCPFTVGTGMNNRYLGNWIFRVRDVNSGLCVSTHGDTTAGEGACGNANGGGAANGVIFIQGNGGFYYINRYWSNHYATPMGVNDPGCIGCTLPLANDANDGLTAWDHGFV